MLKYRLITGSLLVAFIVIITSWHNPVAGGILILVAIIAHTAGVRELVRFGTQMGNEPAKRLLQFLGGLYCLMIGLAGLVTHYGLIELDSSEVLKFESIDIIIVSGIFITLFMLIGFLLSFQKSDHKKGLLSFLYTIAIMCYFSLPLACLLQIFFIEIHTANLGFEVGAAVPGQLLLFSILVTKSSDIGGYTFGKVLSMRKGGNHKLCPTLSPGKSKEGLFGSFIFSVLVAIGFISTTGDITLTASHGNDIILLNTSRAILLGLILAPIALIGDLIESVFKRASQLKDSGSALPGMGGVMDLLDSLLLAAPICLVYFLIIIRYFN